jgi:type IV pilus assembly protein PilM
MARIVPVWGIEIGQCALKALRCQLHPSDPQKLVADAFDYIEYPKILSQPDADPSELVRDALTQFLSRNSLKGTKVAISVSGQSGLAKFIPLPPVESKKIPDMVKYEAKGQIPFSLDDVVWDYQQMAGGSESDGFAMDTVVGLFAIKRDQVQRALSPYDDAGIPVDIIQLTPPAIYNFTVFDQMPDLPGPENFDPDSPPKSIAVVSLGTDTSDLVITNGFRVWQRSLPIGGSHFTKALTKELKMTFSKAEHLKKNATEADDPKAIYTAMRPVFNDLTTELQRSLNYFRGIDRKAQIGRVLVIGNAVKLQGLQRYLQQNLGLDAPLEVPTSYRGLEGDSVLTAPAFKDNLLSFAVCYGLAVQGLQRGALRTNLIPKEIVRERMVAAKKPWAAAAAATVLLGCTASFAGHWNIFHSVSNDGYKSAFSTAQGVKSTFDKNKSDYAAAKAKLDTVKGVGNSITHNTDGRIMWMEVLKAINDALPADENTDKLTEIKTPDDLAKRNTLFVDEIEMQYFEDISQWFTAVAPLLNRGNAAAPPDAAAVTPPVTPADPNNPAATPPAAALPPGEEAPTGAGWVIQLKGHHFHNTKGTDILGEFVKKRLVDKLKSGSVQLPGSDDKLVTVKYSDLGIKFPVLLDPPKVVQVELHDEEKAKELMEAEKPGREGSRPTTSTETPGTLGKIGKQDFNVQFLWQQTRLSQREEAAKAKAQQQAADKTAQQGVN